MYEYDLSIIVVSWNGRELLDECLTALKKSKDSLTKQIILVNNGSHDGTDEVVKKFYPEVELISTPVNLGFTRANNLAYKQAKGKYILMLNSDAFISANALQKTVGFMEKKQDAGVVGARLVNRDGTEQHCVRSFPTPLKLFLSNLNMDGNLPFCSRLDNLHKEHKIIEECDWVVGCYLLTRKHLIDKMGFFLREEYFMYNDDNDLCKRIKKLGYRTYFYPVNVTHVGGATAKKMSKLGENSLQIDKYQIESQAIYFRKNHGIDTVIRNYLFYVLFDLMKLLKKIALFTGSGAVKENCNHLKIMTKIIIKTNFWNRYIH